MKIPSRSLLYDRGWWMLRDYAYVNGRVKQSYSICYRRSSGSWEVLIRIPSAELALEHMLSGL